MTQNSIRLSWDKEELDSRFQTIMKEIHEQCCSHSLSEKINYVTGANIGGFIKVSYY